jgi:folate-dependent tRNA-U54 methylase TrmFO/GidA
MKRTPSYWIKSRYNPQFEKPYYVACGQLSQTRAKAKAKSLYGFNTMLEYKSENDYNKAIQKLKDEGYIVY